MAVVKEAPALGSEVSLGKVIADARVYSRLFRADDALALHFAAGLTVGSPDFERSFTVGGFPDGALFDVVGTNPAVLRGYPDNAFMGRRFVDANVEYRFPLGHPQRGYRLLPLFVRHLHGAVFADVGHAWSGEFQWRRSQTGGGSGPRVGPRDRARPAPDLHDGPGPRIRGEGRDARLFPRRPRVLNAREGCAKAHPSFPKARG